MFTMKGPITFICQSLGCCLENKKHLITPAVHSGQHQKRQSSFAQIDSKQNGSPPSNLSVLERDASKSGILQISLKFTAPSPSEISEVLLIFTRIKLRTNTCILNKPF